MRKLASIILVISMAFILLVHSIATTDQEYTTIATYETEFKIEEKNRNINIKLASEAINNTKLKPGDVFSFNETVGKRTSSKGYKPAKIISNGKYINAIGGGICQVSSTLFNTAILSGLDITERRNHGLKVGYVPDGRDATVSWGSLDLKFQNTLDVDIEIITEIVDNVLKVSIIAYENWEPHEIGMQVYRKNNGSFELHTTKDGENWQIFKSTYRK